METFRHLTVVTPHQASRQRQSSGPSEWRMASSPKVRHPMGQAHRRVNCEAKIRLLDGQCSPQRTGAAIANHRYQRPPGTLLAYWTHLSPLVCCTSRSESILAVTLDQLSEERCGAR